MNIKSDTNIYDQIQNDIKINESAKSSYWTALLNKIDLNNYLIEDRKLNGTFGNFSKKNI